MATFEIYGWNLQVNKFWYALSALAIKIFQKQIVFVFAKSWSRDQLMQKAYCNCIKLMPEKPHDRLS